MPNSPPLRCHDPLQLVLERVGSNWTFGLTVVEPTLFRVVGIDTSRPSHFDGTNFPYYRARMACYLEAVDLGVWRVTHDNLVQDHAFLTNKFSIEETKTSGAHHMD